ncbi:hypothetical protein A2U01_0072706, partial [Trifolium medium]|nr:hypothetical protein [Trifolium medium]
MIPLHFLFINGINYYSFNGRTRWLYLALILGNFYNLHTIAMLFLLIVPPHSLKDIKHDLLSIGPEHQLPSLNINERSP